MDSSIVMDVEDVKSEMFHLVDDENNVTYTTEDGNDSTVFVQQGQFVIPIMGQTVVLHDNEGNFQQYIINDTVVDNETEAQQPIIYYTGDSNGENLFVSPDESTTPPLVDDAEDGEQEMQDCEQLMIVSDEVEPLYQYAILKNGRLHLQAGELPVKGDDQQQELQEQLDAFQQSITLDESTLNCDTIDLDKITGKNLITGQTVTLESYFDKLQKRLSTDQSRNVKRLNLTDDDLINKKLTIGKTASGKKIVGKILRIQTSDTGERKAPKVEETVTQPQIIIKKHIVTRENFDFNIGNTLTGLMELETVQHKLQNKNLVVKVVEKIYEYGKDNFSKTISYVYGRMEETDAQRWNFVPYNEPSDENNDKLDVVEGSTPSTTENSESITDVLLQGDDEETVSLTILTVIDRHGKKSTKVNLSPQQSRYKCHICRKALKSAPQLQKHISETHSGEWMTCELCGIQFSSAAVLHRHKKIHSGEKWYQCSKCSKSFNTAGSLKRHLTVHDPSLRPLECSVCTQRFTDESSLRKHLLIHTGIRAYRCDVCNRAFRNQGDLNFHRRIHDPVKQFSCDVCGRAFSRHSNMLRHAEIHRGSSALYRCDICGCSYSFISSLTRHIVQKHISEEQEHE